MVYVVWFYSGVVMFLGSFLTVYYHWVRSWEEERMEFRYSDWVASSNTAESWTVHEPYRKAA